MTRTVAFFSYTRADDASAGGLLTEIRRRLEDQIELYVGRSIEVFQDVDDIKAGEDWRGRLERALDEAVLLIPIVTPRFFHSEPCRIELERFIAKGKELGRDDLILPILWVDSPIMSSLPSESRDALIEYVSRKQWTDWSGHIAKTVDHIDIALLQDINAFARVVAERLHEEERRATKAAAEAETPRQTTGPGFTASQAAPRQSSTERARRTRRSAFDGVFGDSSVINRIYLGAKDFAAEMRNSRWQRVAKVWLVGGSIALVGIAPVGALVGPGIDDITGKLFGRNFYFNHGQYLIIPIAFAASLKKSAAIFKQ